MANKRILVVDNESEIVSLLRAELAAAGYEVDDAANAETALDLVKTIVYDAAILGVNLPDTDGIVLHRQIRKTHADLARRTLFTSRVTPRDKMEYVMAESSGFVPKPFDVAKVSRWVARLTTED
jgi:DNA-binding response OmpR family regulator